jgi:hypothetical protein
MMEKKGVDLHNQPQELIHSIHEYFKREPENKGPLILCVKIHSTEQFALTENQRSTILHLAPLYVLYFHAPSSPLYFLPSHRHVIGTGLSHQL